MTTELKPYFDSLNRSIETHPMTDKPSKKKYAWVLFGIIWGPIMVLLKGVFEPLFYDEPITWSSIIHDILLWIPAGIILGLVMHLITNRTKKKD
ncbi:MAG: hypothetical protein ACJATE_000495 [Bacteroidia bacterium]|jgi:hypothetical protein